MWVYKCKLCALLYIKVKDYMISNSQEVENILTESFGNLHKRHGGYSIQDVETEIINQACKFIIEKYKNEIKSVHDINLLGTVILSNKKFHPIAKMFVDTASKMFPNGYGHDERKAGFNAIYQNISWSGMWDFLRDYFQKRHGCSIDKIVGEPIIFYSQKHKRFENGVLINTSVVPRNINLNIFSNTNEIIVSIEPTLSAKKGNLISSNNNVLIYNGADPDYRFTITLDNYREVDEFKLELPKRGLALHYF